MAETGPGSIRDGVRWGLLLAAVAVSGYRLSRVVRNFQAWRDALASQEPPSVVEAYHTVFMVEAVGIAIVLLAGIGLFYLLRRRAKPPLR